MQRPWNKTPLPVYSLVTRWQEGIYNMNICTYVIPVSLKPKLYTLALDRTTKTYDNFIDSEISILQILSKKCKKYVRTLWKTSGKHWDKLLKIQKSLWDYETFPILLDCVATLKLEKIQKLDISQWDHDVFLVKVLSYAYLNPDFNILTTDDIYST